MKNECALPLWRRLQSLLLPLRGLIWQLCLLIILPLSLLTVIMAFGSLAVHQRAMRVLVGERDERAVRMAAAALEAQLEYRQQVMQSLALLADATPPDRIAGMLSASAHLLQDFNLGMALFNPQGEMVEYLGARQFWEAEIPLIQPQLRALNNQGPGTALLTSALQDPANQAPAVMALALSPEGKWVAVGASSASSLVQQVLAAANASGASVLLVDTNRLALYEDGLFASLPDPLQHPGVTEALRGESGVTYVQAGDSEHVVTYSPVAPLGWALILEEPWEMLVTPTLRATQLAPLVLVPVLLLTLLALWFGLRWVVQPLQALESRADRLAWGDFEAIEQPVGGISEIRRLQAGLIHMAHKVRVAQQSLRSYIGAITAGQEEERRRLARELHDDTLQSLIALKQRVQLAQLAMNDGRSAESLDEVVSLTEQAIDNLRRQTRALRPIYLEELGLVPALEMLAGEVSQIAGIAVDFHCQGEEKRLPADVELALYRMAQEALNNVMRHAQATRAALKITFTSQGVDLQVSDNGKGFVVPKSPAEFAPGGHFGLLGLYERAELIGARLEIHSTPGEGTQVTIHLPA